MLTRLLLLHIAFSRLQDDVAYEGEVAPQELLVGGAVPLDELLGEVEGVTERGSSLAHLHFLVVRCTHSLVLLGNVPSECSRSDKHCAAVLASQLFLMHVPGHFLQPTVGDGFIRLRNL